MNIRSKVMAVALALLVGAAVQPPATAGAQGAPGAEPPVEEPGPDTGNDLDLPPVAPDPDAVGNAPATPGFGFGIEDLQAYHGQSTCDPVAKPGVLALRTMLLRAYPGTGDLGITRACSAGGQSEHKEGRAFDWKVSAASPTQRAKAEEFLAWLLATDEHGHRFARARRLGIMYIIWNHRRWRAYHSNEGWTPYTGPNPHTDHVHFSFSWDGALEKTSWWDPASTYTSIESPPVGTAADFDGDGFDDVFFHAPGPAADRIRWGAPAGDPEPVTDYAVAGSYRPISGDFNGDAADDILWYRPGAASDWIWPGTPGSRTFGNQSTRINGDYRPISGDFDGNGVDDIVWYGPGPLPDNVWWGKQPGSFAHTDGTLRVAGVYDPFAGDFNGDGADDILWYGHGTLPDGLWLGTPGQHAFRHRPLQADQPYRPFIGDFDGDGIDDVFWYGPGGGWGAIQWGDRSPDLGSDFTGAIVHGTYVPLSGDYDGNGADDIVWYRPGSGQDFRWRGRPGKRTLPSGADSILGLYTVF